MIYVSFNNVLLYAILILFWVNTSQSIITNKCIYTNTGMDFDLLRFSPTSAKNLAVSSCILLLHESDTWKTSLGDNGNSVMSGYISGIVWSLLLTESLGKLFLGQD